MKTNSIKYFITTVFLMIGSFIKACPVCDRNKANQITLGLTHGAGPGNSWEWLIIIGMVLITLLALFLAIKFFIKPDNKERSEFKKIIAEESQF